MGSIDNGLAIVSNGLFTSVTGGGSLIAPLQPSILSVQSMPNAAIQVNIAFNGMTASFSVYRSLVGASGPWTLVGTVSPSAVSFLDTIGTYATQAWYQITATNAAGTSPASTVIMGSTASDPATMLVKTNIRNAIKLGLNSIVKGNPCGLYTFKNTVRLVCDPPQSPVSFAEIPAINLFFGKETTSEQTINNGDNRGLLDQTFEAVMDCYLNDADNPALAQESILADIQAYFGLNYWIPDQYGNKTVHNCLVTSAEPFGLKLQNPTCMMSITLKVRYRLSRTNPTQII